MCIYFEQAACLFVPATLTIVLTIPMTSFGYQNLQKWKEMEEAGHLFIPVAVTSSTTIKTTLITTVFLLVPVIMRSKKERSIELCIQVEQVACLFVPVALTIKITHFGYQYSQILIEMEWASHLLIPVALDSSTTRTTVLLTIVFLLVPVIITTTEEWLI